MNLCWYGDDLDHLMVVVGCVSVALAWHEPDPEEDYPDARMVFTRGVQIGERPDGERPGSWARDEAEAIAIIRALVKHRAEIEVPPHPSYPEVTP